MLDPLEHLPPVVSFSRAEDVPAMSADDADDSYSSDDGSEHGSSISSSSTDASSVAEDPIHVSNIQKYCSHLLQPAMAASLSVSSAALYPTLPHDDASLDGSSGENGASLARSVAAAAMMVRTASDLAGLSRSVPMFANMPLLERALAENHGASISFGEHTDTSDFGVGASALPLHIHAAADGDSRMDIEDTAKCSCSADAPLPPSTARYRTFFDMPREVRLRVFHHLSEMDLLMVSKVCRDWRTLALDGALWRVLNAGAWGHNVTDTQLGVIGTTAAGFLRVANFRGCVQLRPETLKSIAACAPNLETLVLTGCQSNNRADSDGLVAKIKET